MKLSVVVRPEAAADLFAARDWYDRQRAGLADAFAAQVAAVCDPLAAMPELFAVTWQGVRACRVRKFPYVVHDRALTDRVEILAVLHSSRDPSTWRERA